MNIAIISLKTENKRSGIWHYTNDLLKTLSVSEHNLSFISDKNSIDGCYSSNIIKKITMVNYSNKVTKWLLLSFKLHRIALQYRFDVMHFTSEDIPVIYLSFLKKIKLFPSSIKLVCTLHDLGEFVINTKRYGFFKWVLRHLTIPLILDASDIIIVPSKNTFSDIERIFGNRFSKKTRIIFNPIKMDVELLEKSSKAFSGLKIGKYFLYVAELNHPSKNHIRLINAFEKLARDDKYEDFALILAGPEGRNAANILQSIKESAFSDRLRYLGYVEQGLLFNLYKNAFALLLISLYEGFGRPVVEGMYFGLPVIASNRGSLPEVARDAAIYVDPENEDSICAGMKRLIDHPEIWKELSDRATSVCSEYSEREIRKVFLETYVD